MGKPFVTTSVVLALAITGLVVSPPALRRHTVSVRVCLAGRNPSALAAAAKAVTTPRSSTFRHFITPA